MADPRTTSEAKAVQLDSYEENALDRQPPLRESFNETPVPRESEMVSGDAADLNYDPPFDPALARAEHQADMAADHQAAMTHNAAPIQQNRTPELEEIESEIKNGYYDNNDIDYDHER